MYVAAWRLHLLVCNSYDYEAVRHPRGSSNNLGVLTNNMGHATWLFPPYYEDLP
jgi:hypothetical protein